MKITLFIIVALMLCSTVAFAVGPVIVPGNPPGTLTTPVPAGQLIKDIYQIALLVAGLLAFGAIVFGAIRYSLGGGNTSTQHDATDQITQALLGLVLLFGAYLILQTIHPEIPGALGLDALPGITTLPSPAAPVGCRDGVCETIQGIPHVSCKQGIGCAADPRVVALLRDFSQRAGSNLYNIQVTEGMPPSPGVHHEAGGHANGCAIDVVVIGGDTNCNIVRGATPLLEQSHLRVWNEYSNCPEGHTSSGWTASHLHLTGC